MCLGAMIWSGFMPRSSDGAALGAAIPVGNWRRGKLATMIRRPLQCGHGKASVRGRSSAVSAPSRWSCFGRGGDAWSRSLILAILPARPPFPRKP